MGHITNIMQFSDSTQSDLFMSVSQPVLAEIHRDLQGGMASSKTVHTGTYIVHRKNFRYGEHCTFTNGKNW